MVTGHVTLLFTTLRNIVCCYGFVLLLHDNALTSILDREHFSSLIAYKLLQQCVAVTIHFKPGEKVHQRTIFMRK